MSENLTRIGYENKTETIQKWNQNKSECESQVFQVWYVSMPHKRFNQIGPKKCLTQSNFYFHPFFSNEPFKNTIILLIQKKDKLLPNRFLGQMIHI